MENKHSKNLSQGVFNTLAQNGTTVAVEAAIIVNGKGSDLSNGKALKGKAKRKLITQKMVLNLIDVSKKNGTTEREKGYWNTFHCQSKIYTANGRLYGKYCKNRFCTLCCAIRKAEIINKYLPEIQKWEKPYFVTLTIKAYPYKHLRKVMQKVIAGFKFIVSKHRKRNQRGNGIRLVGIKSLECNFNPVKKTYNPHLHLIVQSEAVADILIKEWLANWKGYTNYKAQYKRKVENRERDLIEIVKYGSKIFTEPDVNKKAASTGPRQVYAAALDNILKAMQGLRIFDRFGFNLPKEASRKETRATIVSDFAEWIYDNKTFDWFNVNSGEALTKFHPLFNLLTLLELNVDNEKE
jgi:plasmid rolling circle replication initiator protein Rep